MNKESITMEEFQNILKDKLEERLGDDFTIMLQKVPKNNGVCLQGINIKNRNENISPNIYLEGLWSHYQKGLLSVEEVVEQIIYSYEENQMQSDIDVEAFMEFASAKDKIFMKLVNKEANRTLLKNVPHVDYLDLAIVFVYMVEQKQMERGTILVQNQHMERWGVSVETLYEVAFENTPTLFPYQLNSLRNVMMEIVQNQLEEDQELWNELLEQDDPSGLYVLSNTSRIFGACSMLYPNILHDFGRAVRNDFYILPSSVHEVLLLPVDEEVNPVQLQACVQEVNETQLAPEDVLSGSIYYYNRKLKKVTKIL